MSLLPTTIFLFCLCVETIYGHGRMMDPPNRSSVWRVHPEVGATANYVDDMNNCGGKTTQWDTFNGKCGICGDRYDDPHPQANENTGTYGQGVVVKQYRAGSVIDVGIVLTTNHMGYFEFSLCKLSNLNSHESGDDCFQKLTLGDGSSRYVLPNQSESGYTEVNVPVALPAGLTCDRCVLRWHWTVANSWGTCDNGSQGIGCGPQETFRSCADIAIV